MANKTMTMIVMKISNPKYSLYAIKKLIKGDEENNIKNFLLFTNLFKKNIDLIFTMLFIYFIHKNFRKFQ